MIQETFLRLWLQRRELHLIQNPSAWIYRIASNLSYTHLRTQINRNRLMQNVVTQTENDTVAEFIDSKELNGMIQKAVSLLPERRQEVYRLSRDNGLTHVAIAEKLNLSVNTVKNHIGTSLKFIQEYINNITGLSVTILTFFLKS